jgi:hypothetical protein
MAETDSASSIDEGQAAAGTRGATVGATGQAAGTAAGTTEAGAGAQGRMAAAEAAGDIQQTEAYTINLKRLVENALTHDATMLSHERQMMEATKSAFEQMVESNAAAYNRILQNAVTTDQGIANAIVDAVHKTSRTSLFEVDKLENLDENNPYLAAIVKVIADMVSARVAKE